MTLSEFLEEVSPMENYASFDEVLSGLTSDPTESDLIAELREALRSGPFTKPLWVEDGVLINGYHRYCALALEKTPSFDVVFDLPQDPTPEVTAFSVTLPEMSIEQRDEYYDRAFSAARSLYTPRGWLEADNVYIHDGVLTYEYYAALEQVAAATDLIIARLVRHGLVVSLHEIRDCSDDYAEE
jgi:hypothetical protein